MFLVHVAHEAKANALHPMECPLHFFFFSWYMLLTEPIHFTAEGVVVRWATRTTWNLIGVGWLLTITCLAKVKCNF